MIKISSFALGKFYLSTHLEQFSSLVSEIFTRQCISIFRFIWFCSSFCSGLKLDFRINNAKNISLNRMTLIAVSFLVTSLKHYMQNELPKGKAFHHRFLAIAPRAVPLEGP